ncbi:MAG: hypothetical protein DWQ05_03170 [Calditrichaeota bacterium]|nr:MAG: hypothetical protein DWQ05_03170 [Calditrichota bacterium]
MQIEKNELRRDPISGSWTVVIHNTGKLEELLQPIDNASVQVEKKIILEQYGAGDEILRIMEEGATDEKSWLLKVVAGQHPVLQIHGALNNRGKGLYDVCDGVGAHEIVIESREPGIPFEAFDVAHLTKLLTAYSARILDLKKDDRFRYIMVHKKQYGFNSISGNRAISHIVATPITPLGIRLKLESCLRHFKYKERCLFCDIIYQEQDSEERLITENDAFVAISPFAATVPFHMMILPKDHEPFFEKNEKLNQLAEILKDVLNRFKTVTGQNAYEILINSAPNLESAKRRGYWKTLTNDYHWHLEILPTLKFKNNLNEDVGFPINFVSPEKVTRLLQQ